MEDGNNITILFSSILFLHQIVEFFRENKPIVVNSLVGEVWTIELLLDTSIDGNESEDNVLILKKEIIQPIPTKGRLQQYSISIK